MVRRKVVKYTKKKSFIRFGYKEKMGKYEKDELENYRNRILNFFNKCYK